MGRTRKTEYLKTVFAKRIVELQQRYKYTDQYIVDNVQDEYGLQFITTLQSYQKWKNGERLPSNLQSAIIAFADFYGVSVEYLLREEAPETPQIKSVQDATGLSSDAVRKLLSLHKDFPVLSQMVDTVLSSLSNENEVLLVNLLEQILSDYNDKKNGQTSSSYNMEKMQERILRAQQMYNFFDTIVENNMADYLDKEIEQRASEAEYYSSDEGSINILSALKEMDNTSPISDIEISVSDRKNKKKT